MKHFFRKTENSTKRKSNKRQTIKTETPTSPPTKESIFASFLLPSLSLSSSQVSSASKDAFSLFPLPTFSLIICFLPVQDLLNCSLLNKRFYKACCSNELWKQIVIECIAGFQATLELLMQIKPHIPSFREVEIFFKEKEATSHPVWKRYYLFLEKNLQKSLSKHSRISVEAISMTMKLRNKQKLIQQYFYQTSNSHFQQHNLDIITLLSILEKQFEDAQDPSLLLCLDDLKIAFVNVDKASPTLLSEILTSIQSQLLLNNNT